MKILVTGGTGFVGSNIVNQIKDQHDITITAQSNENDITTKVLESNYIFDAIIHQAANNDTLCENKQEVFDANVYEPTKLFKKLLDNGCKKFIYASSTAVYGNNYSLLKENSKTNPLNVYAESKLVFDEFAMNFAKENNVSVIGLRYCNVFGSGEKHKKSRMSMIGQILYNAYHNKTTNLFKYGQQCRDWVDVQDVVNANVLSLNSNKTGIYNIASSSSINFMQLVELIEKIINKKLLINWVDCPFPERYQEFIVCSINKATNDLNYYPNCNLINSIENYWNYIISS